MVTENSKKLNDLRKKLEKKYKEDTELFPDFTTIKTIEVIPSPSAIINTISGIGGFPRGRISEIHGPYSSGKTTICTEVIATAQQNDPEAVAMFLDFEHAWDPRYARKLGTSLDPDRLVFMQPTYFEQGADAALYALSEGLIDILVIDSAAAMTPRSEIEGIMDNDGGSQKGTQSALMAQFLAKASKLLSKGRKPAMVLINQTRAVINIGGRPQKNAPKEQAAGGNAIKFYTSMRFQLEVTNQEGDSARGTKGTDQVYTQNRVRVTCVKNKLAPPFMRGQIVIEYGKGINNLVSLGELAEAKLGIMSGAGFFKYQGDIDETSFSCRGREAFLELLAERPALQKELEAKVIKAIRLEHAEMLGLDDIKVQGTAKNIEGNLDPNDSRIILESEGSGDIPTSSHLEDGTGLLVEDLE